MQSAFPIRYVAQIFGQREFIYFLFHIFVHSLNNFIILHFISFCKFIIFHSFHTLQSCNLGRIIFFLKKQQFSIYNKNKKRVFNEIATVFNHSYNNWFFQSRIFFIFHFSDTNKKNISKERKFLKQDT